MCKQKNSVKVEYYKVLSCPFTWFGEMTIIKVMKGSFKVHMTGVSYLLNPGDMFLINKFQIYKLTKLSYDNEIAVVRFSTTMLKRNLPDFDDMIFIFDTVRFCDGGHVCIERMRQIINDIIHLHHKNKNMSTVMQELFTLLKDHFDFVRCGYNFSPFPDKVHKRYKLLYRHIKSHEEGLHSLSLKESAKLMGISYSYLRGDLVARYGKGVKKLLHTLIVNKAAIYIITSDTSITGIMHRCNFSDHKYLIAYFRHFFQCTPSEFKKQYHGKRAIFVISNDTTHIK